MSLVSVSYPRLMLNLAEKNGIDISGLPESLLSSIRNDSQLEYVPFSQLVQLNNYIQRDYPTSNVGAELGLSLSESSHGFLIYALKSSRTLEDSLASLKRYMPMVADILDFEIFTIKDKVVLECVEVCDLKTTRPLILEFIVSVLFKAFCLRFPECDPARDYHVRLPYSKPDWVEDFKEHWPFELEYNADSLQFMFKAQWLTCENPFYDEGLHRVIIEELDKRLKDFQLHWGMSGLVRKILQESLPQLLSIEEVADELGCSSRTLRRKLKAENVTFSELLTQVRKRLSLALLRQSNLTVDQISSELGYSISSSFITAFKNWTGCSPGAMRKSYHHLDVGV